MGPKYNKNVERMFILQKRCLRLMTFSAFDAPSSVIFSRLNLLKISDLIKLRNVILVHQILNSESPPRVSSIFSLSYYQHRHQTRGNSSYLLSRPSFRTNMYGTNSITYKSIIFWNELQQLYPNSPLNKMTKGKLKQTYHTQLTLEY